MLASELTARGEEQSRAVESGRVALDHANDQGSAGVARELAERFGLRPRHLDRFAPVLQESVASLRRAIADARAEVRALRIAAEQRLGHHDELRTGVTDRVRVAENAIERGSGAVGLRADLQGGDSGGAHGDLQCTPPHDVASCAWH